MIKVTTPADTDTGAAIIAQLLTNDKQNLTQDENAVLSSGISEGIVVKYSVGQSKWIICDGTAALLDTDSIGVATYADGTSGQVKTSGVYANDDLSTVGKYYCQSDGSIGTTATKVFIGNVTSPGRLCLPGGSGGGGNIATATSLGQVVIGDGIDVTADGRISFSSSLKSSLLAKIAASDIMASLASKSGYIKIPNSTGNDLIVQFFRATTNSTSNTYVTFPVQFPNACIIAIAFAIGTASGITVSCVAITDTSKCHITTQYAGDISCGVLAIGY